MTEKLHFDDLTKITCPPGLLDADTFQRLDEWWHGYEMWNGYYWVASPMLSKDAAVALRAKPAPVKRVGWANVTPTGIGPIHDSRVGCDAWNPHNRIAVIRLEWDSTGNVEMFKEDL